MGSSTLTTTLAWRRTGYRGFPAIWLASAVACTGGGGAPELSGLTDQLAVVGSELTLDLDGTDPDGDQLSYSFRAAGLPAIYDAAVVTVSPSGAGVFRWTPLAGDLGAHAFDFTVSDGGHRTTVTITIDVRSAIGAATAPVFRQPLGTGTTFDVAAGGCLELDVVVDDQDSAEVVLGQDEPLIAGAELRQGDGLTARWRWCPSADQQREPRHTLMLTASDGANPKTVKPYVIVLRGGAPACADDGHEDDDSDAQARATSYPRFASTGNAICSGDDDRYRVPLFTGEVMTVALTFTQTRADEDLDLHLYRGGVDLTPCDPETADLCSPANGQGGASNERTSFTTPAGCDAGCDHVVVVRGYDGAANSYAIAIEVR